jgi:hypothetical protein
MGDRQPRVTLLLLEHLQPTASRRMRPQIRETKRFILQRVSSNDGALMLLAIDRVCTHRPIRAAFARGLRVHNNLPGF